MRNKPRPGRAPDETWWVINGGELLSALHRVAKGDDPNLAYTELYANTHNEGERE